MKKRICMAIRLCPRCGKMYTNHRDSPCPVTDEMLEAIRKYKAFHGRTWKDQLRRAWLRNDVQSLEMQVVRMIIGPYRISKVKL